MDGNGARALVEALIEQGVDTVFGYPGGAIIPTYDALYGARDRVRHVLARHEQGAVHAAEGYARASGRVGVCIATSGPGATNLITGLQNALMDSTPLVCITGQVASPLLGSDAFQEADVIGLTLAATKWNVQVDRPDDVAGAVERAFAIARAGRPGPVLIDITRDAQSGALGGAGREYPAVRTIAPSSPDRDAVATAARWLDEARRPLLIAGHGVLIARAERELVALAERVDAPVASTLLGLSAMPSAHRLAVGMVGMHGAFAVNRLTEEADLILGLGMRFDDRATGATRGYGGDARIVHVDVDPAEFGRHVRTDLGIAGDAREVLAALLARSSPASHPEWLGRFGTLAAEEHDALAIEPGPPSATPTMDEVVDVLSRRSAGDALLVTDVGQHQMVCAQRYGFARARSLVSSGGLGTMGFGLPAALGAALGAPERAVVAVVGDGGAQMSIQELGTIAQERAPVKVVVINNGWLGMVRQWQEMFHEERYSCTEIANPDFVAVAAAYGIPGERASVRGDLESAVERLLAADGPRLLEVAVERASRVMPMVPPGRSVGEVRVA